MVRWKEIINKSILIWAVRLYLAIYAALLETPVRDPRFKILILAPPLPPLGVVDFNASHLRNSNDFPKM